MMAVKFLSICLALYTVAVDAIHVQAGLHRHGAGDKTCPQVVGDVMIKTGYNMMIDMMPLKASQLGSILLQNVSMTMERNNQSHAVNVVTKAEKAQYDSYDACDTTDWQVIAGRVMRVINFFCQDGTETKQYIMTEWKMHPDNVDPAELAKFMSWGFGETITVEEDTACQHFDPGQFMGWLGLEMNEVEYCLHHMYAFTMDCHVCVMVSLKDMIGDWYWEMPGSCAMKCQNNPQDPACLECSEPIMTNMGKCMAGESYKNKMVTEVMKALMNFTSA